MLKYTLTDHLFAWLIFGGPLVVAGLLSTFLRRTDDRPGREAACVCHERARAEGTMGDLLA